MLDGPIRLINDLPRGRSFVRPPDYYASFLTGFQPEIGSPGVPYLCARASQKRQQRILSAGDLLGNNTAAIPNAFNGEVVHPGALVEGAITNEVPNADDLSMGWLAPGCAVTPPNQTDPFGAANSANTLTPASAVGLVRTDLPNNCNGLNYAGGVWARSLGAGAHQFRVRLRNNADATDEVVTDRDLDGNWQYVPFEHMFGAAVGTPRMAILPDRSGNNNPTAVRMPFARRGSSTLSTPCGTTSAHEYLYHAAPAGARGSRMSFAAWVRPLHAPADSLNHYYFIVTPINANPLSNMVIGKNNANQLGMVIDNGGGPRACRAAVNDSNWAREKWHHLGASLDAQAMDLYVNGNAVDHAGPGAVGDLNLPGASVFALGYVPAGGGPSAMIMSRLSIWYDYRPPGSYFKHLFRTQRSIYGV